MLYFKTQWATRGVINIHNAGVVINDGWIGALSQSYDFLIYSYNASVVAG
jgi:hypothetical protein